MNLNAAAITGFHYKPQAFKRLARVFVFDCPVQNDLSGFVIKIRIYAQTYMILSRAADCLLFTSDNFFFN